MSIPLVYLFEITICASINKMYISTLDLQHQYGNINGFSRILSYPDDASCDLLRKIFLKW
jgi:hypothetical protein